MKLEWDRRELIIGLDVSVLQRWIKGLQWATVGKNVGWWTIYNAMFGFWISEEREQNKSQIG